MLTNDFTVSFINSFGDWFRGRGQSKNKFNWRNFLYEIGSPFSYRTLSDKKAMEMYVSAAAIYTVVGTIADGISALPIVLAIEDSDGSRETVTEGEVYDFVFNPNPEQTRQEFWELQSAYYLINGESYSYKNTVSVGFTPELVSLPPETMNVVLNDEGSLLSSVNRYEFTDNGQVRRIDPEDILHLKMTNPTLEGRRKKNGLSPLQAGFNLGNAAINTETFISWYFENRGVSNIVSGNGNPVMSLQDEDVKGIRRAAKSQFGGAHRANALEIIQNPVEVTQLNASSTDMETVTNYNLVVTRVAAIYNLPEILVQVNETASFNNVQEAEKRATNHVYIPTAEKFIGGYDRAFLKDFSEELPPGKKYVMYVDVDKVGALQQDPQERKRNLQEEVKIGAISRNEYRIATNREESNEEGMNTPTVQQNIIPVTQIDEKQE